MTEREALGPDAPTGGRPGVRALDGRFSIHRLPPDSELPAELAREPMVWVGRTEDELSVVCRDRVELEASGEVSPGWRAIQVEGPLDFGIVGLLAEMTGALAAAGISVFALSTFDTDHVLVREERLDEALERLRAAGFGAHQPPRSGERAP